MPAKAISEIIAIVQQLLVDEPAKALKYLQEQLPEGSEKRNQTILLEGRLGQTNKAYQNGQIKFEDQQIVVANVNAAILDLISSLSDVDFAPKPGAGQAAPAAVPKFVTIYAPEDQEHCKLLNKHLNVLKITKKIRVYNVNETLGADLVAQAKSEMADADYLLVLITVNLFNSPDWFDVVYTALGEGRRMIPLRIEKADFEGTGLEKLRALPSMGKAVSEFPNQDSAYADIAAELRRLLPK